MKKLRKKERRKGALLLGNGITLRGERRKGKKKKLKKKETIRQKKKGKKVRELHDIMIRGRIKEERRKMK